MTQDPTENTPLHVDDGANAIVSVAMGSRSDLATLQPALDMLEELQVPHEAMVVSAHRTPQWMAEYASKLEDRGIEVVIAAAGGAAHLPGMLAAQTLVPVLGVPVQVGSLGGVDALLSIAQMPKGVPVGTLAIGASGAMNAALLAAQVVSTHRPALRQRLHAFRAERTAQVMKEHVIR